MTDGELLARVEVLQSRLEGAAVVTPDRARESLTRLVNSHFRNRDEHARFSVPANPQRDDDLLLESFIARSELEWLLGTLAARGFSKALSKVQSERDELRREVEVLRAERDQFASVRPGQSQPGGCTPHPIAALPRKGES
jgi:hypothetical protein